MLQMRMKNVVTPVSPNVTRWTAHDRAYKSFCDGYKQILPALSTCVDERKERDALGIFQEISSKRFLATTLMLRDVFAAIQPSNLVEKTINSLDKLKTAS